MAISADVRDLIREGILRPAEQPPMNPQAVDEFQRYTLPLIAHDYPAKTAAMWNSAYRAFSMDAGNIMMVGEPQHAQAIYRVLRSDDRYLGGGAGVGFKEAAIAHLDELDDVAKLTGSVNFTRKTPGGALCGHNTDGIGYVTALANLLESRQQDLKGKNVLLLGAGGTACSIAFALAGLGARISIVNRTAPKAETLAARVNQARGEGCAVGASEEETIRHATTADVIVNVSMKGSAGELADYSALGRAVLPVTAEALTENLRQSERILEFVRPGTVVSDVVIVKGRTPLLRQAMERGFTVLDGVPMVINQAIEAFWILHGPELQPTGVSKESVGRVMREAAGRSETETQPNVELAE